MIALKEQPSMEADLEGASPDRIIDWAVDAIGEERIVVATSFGPTGMVNLHHLARVAPEVPVVFIDTLYHFDATLELADRARQRYGLDLRVYRAADSRADFERQHGSRLWERDLDAFHRLTKVEPMERALEGVGGWITGRRRDQSASRTDLPVVEYNGRVKVNPLAGWTLDDVWSFIRAHDVPYNPLHDQGYASIGDEPLTTPVGRGEDERAGRWRGDARLECGLHSI